MNKLIRIQLEKFNSKLHEFQDQLNDIKESVELIKDEEEEKYGNMPESLQGSETIVK